jgi:hypothetical protein
MSEFLGGDPGKTVKLVSVSAYEENIEHAKEVCVWSTSTAEKTKRLVNMTREEGDPIVYLMFTSVEGDEKHGHFDRFLHGIAILGSQTDVQPDWPKEGYHDYQPCFKIRWIATYHPKFKIESDRMRDIADITWTNRSDLSSIFKQESKLRIKEPKLFAAFRLIYGPMKNKAKKPEKEKPNLRRGQLTLAGMGFAPKRRSLSPKK